LRIDFRGEGDAWSMKSIRRLISVGRSTKAARSSERLISVEVSPGWLMAATMKPASGERFGGIVMADE
jgi:hypothetical protein